jgi:hypothetical protein
MAPHSRANVHRVPVLMFLLIHANLKNHSRKFVDKVWLSQYSRFVNFHSHGFNKWNHLFRNHFQFVEVNASAAANMLDDATPERLFIFHIPSLNPNTNNEGMHGFFRVVHIESMVFSFSTSFVKRLRTEMFIKQSKVSVSINSTLHGSSHFFLKILSSCSQICHRIQRVFDHSRRCPAFPDDMLNKNDGGWSPVVLSRIDVFGAVI